MNTKDPVEIAEIENDLKYQDAPEFSESDKATEAEDLLRDMQESVFLGELLDILTPSVKTMKELDNAVFEAAMNDEKVKAMLIVKAQSVYAEEIQKRLEILHS